MPRDIIEFLTENWPRVRFIAEFVTLVIVGCILVSSHLSRVVGDWLNAHSDGILAYRTTKRERFRNQSKRVTAVEVRPEFSVNMQAAETSRIGEIPTIPMGGQPR